MTALRPLHDDIPPFATREFAVSHGHFLHVEEWGHPGGLPVVSCHGGPGSGSSPLLRRFFDPRRFRVVCIDQRGAGRSRPRGGTADNTTALLVADMIALRDVLAIPRWLVAGGSWGATLALAYALADREATAALLLRAPFLARPTDVEDFFAGSDLAAAHRDGLLDHLAGELSAVDRARREQAASAWWRWESARTGAHPAPTPPQGAALAALVDRYRVQCHYLRHRCWLDAPPLIDRLPGLPAVPTLILQGEADRICRPEGARLLHAAIPGSRLRIVPGAGHDPTHPAMVDATVRALDLYATHGDFGR